MQYEYNPQNLKKHYEDDKYLSKKYGENIKIGMFKFLNALDAANSALDIFNMRFFFMEHLKDNLKEYYSISLDKKKSKWRLLIQMLDNNGNVIIPGNNEQQFLSNVKKIRIKEMSEHYAK